MTKTLKELQEEHRVVPGYVKMAYIADLEAAKREEEARIAELEAENKRHEVRHKLDRHTIDRWVPCPDHRDKTKAGCYMCANEHLQSQLTAEQQAHAETKQMLVKVCRSAHSFTTGRDELECLNNRLDNVWEAVEEADEYLARQASINRPTDNSPTDDRGEGEKG